jgi:hypothetical protein
MTVADLSASHPELVEGSVQLVAVAVSGVGFTPFVPKFFFGNEKKASMLK